MSGWGMVLALAFLGRLLAPAVAWSQAGLYVTPSFAVAELYDDNVFRSSSNREDDFISRFSPGFQGGYQSEPLTLLGRYTFSAEVFANNPKLTQAQAYQAGGVQFEYRPTRLWTLGFDGDHVETERPEDINISTGIEDGRGRSRSYSFRPSLTYRLSALTTVSGGYGFTRNERSGETNNDGTTGTTNKTHTADLGLDRQLSARDTATVSYIFRRFLSSGDMRQGVVGTNENETSHAVVMGWIHQLSTLSALMLRGGPRFSRGSVAPEVEGSIAREFHRGQVSFMYGRTQNTVVGRSGAVSTESFIGGVRYQLLRRLFLSADPAFYKNSSNGFKTKVYRLDINLVYQFNQWLSLRGSYQFSYEDESGAASSVARRRERYRNMVLLELSVAYPYRVY
ncbi:MAG: outer membrane beta-barrel protein [Deltaproteobacteria bacterium]|nr:outer membrane beta-barrel protein [Deltaproteobacteria bacterium]